MKSKFILLLAVLMALITTFLFYNYMETLNKDQVANRNTVNVVVAKVDIKKDQKISKEMVSFIKMPQKSTHPQTVKSFSEVDGFFANSAIAKGEPILKHRLANEAKEKVFVSKKVKNGYRAVSIGVNLVQSVTNLIEPGDYVDIVFSEEQKINHDQTIINTQLLLQNVYVLAVGRRMIESTSEDSHIEYASVTLELNPTDSVALINAHEKGNIHLILHSRIIPPKGV
ncbi:Flp pilus assembly protein CpaB [Lutibacter sp. B2]|nr:Flp pilus assembly protein CpaB [Lutibacter sp. B2]